ncbi:MAG: hypothetical protein U0L59_07250, partial [Faecalimonas sp.]|nr:hypothetical protein [Faecalimonas sp.]
MKQFLTVLKFELNNYFKNKSFVVTTFILAAVIAAVVIVPTMIPGLLGEEDKGPESGSTGEVVVDDEVNVEADDEVELELLGICLKEEAGLDAEMVKAIYPADWTTYEDEKEMKEAVEMGELEAGFIIESPGEVIYVVNDLSMYDYLGDMFSQMLAENYKQQYLLDKGLTPEEIAESESFYVNVTNEVLGKDGGQNYWYT